MRRRSILYLCLILIGLCASTSTVFAMLVRHIPSFYRDSEAPEGEVRQARSAECEKLSYGIWNTIENGLPWSQPITQEQLNCYLQQESNHSSAGIIELPEEISDIRVAFDADRIRVGFRYGQGWWSSVVNVDLRVWLVAKETNVVAVELCGFRAGALPLGTQVMLDFISNAGRRHDIEVSWFRHEGHPVALLHFQANQPRPTILLSKLEVQPGRFIIAGRPALDPTQPGKLIGN